MNRLVIFLGTLLRQCFWLVALGLVLAALYVSLGRQLVPWVAEYRLEVQDKAQTLLSMPVEVGRLEGRWEGFMPRVLAHDVVLGEGASAMRLDRMALVPDLAASLWAWDWRLASLEFDGVHLSLIQDAGGQWRVEGLPERSDPSPADPEKILSGLQKISRLALLDSQITLEAHGESPLTLSYANLDLHSAEEQLLLQGRVILPDGKPLALRVDAKVQPKQWRDVQAELYLSLPQSDWAPWLPRHLTAAWYLQKLQAGGEFWLSWRDGGLSRAVARLNVSEAQGAHAEHDPLRVEDLSLNAYVDRADEGYRLLLDGLAFNLGDRRWQETRFVVNHDATANRWRLETDRVDVAPVATLVQALVPLPGVAEQTLAALAPNGTLRNLRIDYQPTAALAERLDFAANLDAVSIAAHNWIPAATNVTGSIQGNLGGGELRFDNQDFSLHLAELFAAPWVYPQSRGRLLWTLDDEAFTLAAPYLQVSGEEGNLAGDFLIRLMRDPAAEDYMDLRVGLSDGDARHAAKYLPTRSPAMSPALTEWLTTAIRGGAIEQGYFQYQGSLSKDAGNSARSISLYFKVGEAELAFQPGWPALREGRGEVLIEDSGVRVRLSEGRILDAQIHDASAEIPLGNDQSPYLMVKGTVDGSLGDGLTLLQEAPFGTEEIFAGWSGQGPLSATLDLGIPLAQGQSPRVTVDFSSTGASLSIAQAALELEQLSGDFRYDSERGFSAADIRGRALGSAVRGKATAIGKSGSPATRIEAQGSVALERLLAWQGIKRPVPAAGELPYQLQLTLDGAASQLQIDSSLLGTAIELPAPFGKLAAQRRDTTLKMTLAGDQRRYTLNHGSLAALSYVAPVEDWTQGGGEMVLGGGSANLRSEQGLHVRGSLPAFELNDWLEISRQYGEKATDEAATSLVKSVQLSVGKFEGMGTQVDELDIDLRRVSQAWLLGLNSHTITGNIRAPDDKQLPIGIDLQHVRLPAKADVAVTERTDPLQAIDPGTLPPMNIAIAQVLQGDTPLGASSLKIRPTDGGVEFSDLDLDLKGLKAGGSGGWNGSGTWYKGRLHGGNLADVLLAWNFAPSTTSENFRLDVDGRWPGSPAFFNLERFSGVLDARMSNGQFREIEGRAQALRVFGLLNFNSIGRRLRLDFSDLFGKGLSYDRIKGMLVATDGVYVTDEPITITGPSSNLELDGELDMVKDRIDATLLVTLPVSNNLPLAALIVGAPAIGGALFVVDKLLGDQVARFASVQYKVEGPWQSPEITFDKPFEKPR